MNLDNIDKAKIAKKLLKNMIKTSQYKVERAQEDTIQKYIKETNMPESSTKEDVINHLANDMADETADTLISGAKADIAKTLAMAIVESNKASQALVEQIFSIKLAGTKKGRIAQIEGLARQYNINFIY